jgi:hypothetical protein
MRGISTNNFFKEAMDAIASGTPSLRKASRHWNIPLTYFWSFEPKHNLGNVG